MHTVSVALTVALLLSLTGVALGDGAKYRPGAAFSHVWDAFYTETPHEPELADPLIAAGPRMTQAICEAVLHKDMMYRRYALSALGFIGDRRAIATLERIMNDESEKDYFRGDALQSIFRIDRALGRRYADQYTEGPDYLKMISAAIKRNAPWLTERRGKH